MQMKWKTQSPSNIALIKYMGKIDSEHNIPTNASLSYTLNDLTSTVELELSQNAEDQWEPLHGQPGIKPLALNSAAKQRFLKHLMFIKQRFDYNGSFIVRSGNNFLENAGLASSASSFAALTQCAVTALSEIQQLEKCSIQKISDLSRQGSGSSCRSFYSPWALWSKDTLEVVDLPYKQLIHHVVIVDSQPKAVSSSQAHQRVRTSPQFENRAKRANFRLDQLMKAFNKHDWQQAFNICWEEFIDLHQLFATAQPSFNYMNQATQQVLQYLRSFWEDNNDGPIVTMDAGPNIHLLFRQDQAELVAMMKQQQPIVNYYVL